MATLTKTTRLVSTTISSTESLNLTTTDDLSVTHPMSNLNRKSIATGSAQTIIASNSAFSYIYIKVDEGTNATDWVQIKLGGHALIRLNVGESFFLPIYNGVLVEGESQGGACKVEYGYWTRA